MSEEQQSSIFRSFIDQLNDKNLVEYLKEIHEWIERAPFDFNGRQIRNTVLTAIGLAQNQDAERPKLQCQDLAAVANETMKFQENLKAQEMKYRAQQIDRP